MVRGAYILFSVIIGGTTTTLAFSRDTSLSISAEMEETASYTSADAKELIPGRYTWNMSSAHLVGNFTPNLLDTLISNNTPIEVKFHSDSDDDNIFSIVGTTYLKSYKLGSPLHEFATADVEWQGSSKITPLALQLDEMIWTNDDDADEYTWNHSRWC